MINSGGGCTLGFDRINEMGKGGRHYALTYANVMLRLPKMTVAKAAVKWHRRLEDLVFFFK